MKVAFARGITLWFLLTACGLAASGAEPQSGAESELNRIRSHAQLHRAYELQRAGKDAEALAIFEAQLQKQPGDQEALLPAIELLMKLGENQRAVEHCDVVLKAAPSHGPTLLNRAFARQRLGQSEAAWRDLESALSVSAKPPLSPEQRQFATRMGVDLALALRRYDDALKLLATGAGQYTAREKALREAVAYEGLTRFAEARQRWIQLFESSSSQQEMFQARMASGYLASRLGDYAAAAADFKAALLLQPNDAAARRGLVESLIAQGAWREAGAQVQLMTGQMIDQASRAAAWRRAGELAAKAGRWTEARQAFEKSVLASAKPDPAVVRALADLSAKQGDKEAALGWVKMLAAQSGTTSDLEMLAGLLFETGQFADSARAYDDLAARLQGSAKAAALVHSARAWAQAGDKSSALERLRTAIELQESAELRVEAGLLEASLGRPEEAVAQLTKALSGTLPPDLRLLALKQRGLMLRQMGKLAEAQSDLRQALELAPGDTGVEVALGEVLFASRQYPEAVQLLSKARGARPSPELSALLGEALLGAGDFDAASKIYAALLADATPQTPGAVGWLRASALAAEKSGRPSEAAALYLKAYEWGGGKDAALLSMAIQADQAGGQAAAAYELGERLLATPSLQAGQRTSALLRQGHLAMQLGRPNDAIRWFAQARDAGADGPQVNRSLGFAYSAAGQWEEAVASFKAADPETKDPDVLRALALCYQKLGKNGLAISYLEEAAKLQPGDAEVLNSLGYLYFENADYSAAAAAWGKIAGADASPQLRLRLAQAERLAGQTEAAWVSITALSSLPPGDPLIPEVLQERAELLAGKGDRQQAIVELQKAQALQSSPERAYRIGVLYREEKRPVESLLYLQQAAQAKPDDLQFQTAYGYVLSELKRNDEAIAVFRGVLAKEPGYASIYSDLGFLYERQPNNVEAVKSFKSAIDSLDARTGLDERERRMTEQKVYLLRREVTKLQRRFEFDFYAAQSADSRVVPPSLAAFGLAPQPSQGGVEMAWQPPKIGFRNERQFQVFSRLIWNFEPGSLAIKSSTLQLGVGVRYKPLRTQNLWLSGERLIKLGDLSINNWLLRVMYGWSSLDRLPHWRTRGNYTVVYQDLAFYVQQPRTIAWYGEGRQGYAWRLPGNLVLAPHVMLMGQAFGINRVANPSIQGGIGAALQWWFWNNRYEADRARLEVIGQYRWGILYPIVMPGPTEEFSGPVVIVVLNW